MEALRKSKALAKLCVDMSSLRMDFGCGYAHAGFSYRLLDISKIVASNKSLSVLDVTSRTLALITS